MLHTLRYALIIALLPALAACEQGSLLDEVRERGVLNVATRNGPSTYHPHAEGHDGFEYQMAAEFAKHLGVELNMQSAYGRDDVYAQLRRGESDMAAAGLILSPVELANYRYSAPYLRVQPRVIYKLGTRRPKALKDLYNKRIRIGADSYFSRLLSRVQSNHPDVQWTESHDEETIDLLERIRGDELDHTVLNEHEFIAHRGIYPELSIGMRLGSTRTLNWVVVRDPRAAEFYEELDRFLIEIEGSGRLAELQERYFSYFDEINQAGALQFAGNIKRRLPLYEKLIREVATEHDIEWELLAAVSYQESHWNPDAVSPTGVKGMMMLTEATAKQVNISDRSNLEQSLRGGADYLNKMFAKIPADIPEPDRSWFALASYNVGYGHLEDARKLTEKLGDNPDKWLDVKAHLPKLRQRKWYKQTRYGYARGNEPVTYVQNIRHFYQVLTLRDIARTRAQPPVELSHRAPKDLLQAIPAI